MNDPVIMIEGCSRDEMGDPVDGTVAQHLPFVSPKQHRVTTRRSPAVTSGHLYSPIHSGYVYR